LNLSQGIEEVTPDWIEALNQGKLFGPITGLNLLLASDRVDHGLVSFIPDQYLASISGREALRQSVAVLESTLGQV
jgi:hypothetical protein